MKVNTVIPESEERILIIYGDGCLISGYYDIREDEFCDDDGEFLPDVMGWVKYPEFEI